MPSIIGQVGDLVAPGYRSHVDKLTGLILPNQGSKFIERTPYSKSLFGYMDAALRKLPPDVAREARKIANLSIYTSNNLIGNYLSDTLGQKINDLLDKGKQAIDDLLGTDLFSETKYGADRKVLRFEEDKVNDGFKVSVHKIGKGEQWPLNDSNNFTSNNIADTELNNAINKFIPHEDYIWLITLSRYEDDDVKTALPELPKFKGRYDDSKIVIDYEDWLPAMSYNYRLRSVASGATFNYGWNRQFDQVSSIIKGNEFSITLMDDRNNSFSNYARNVIDLSASYNEAAITYWKSLVFKINLILMNRQWEVKEKYQLLGLLKSDGNVNFQPDMPDEIQYSFEIVGEVPVEITTNS